MGNPKCEVRSPKSEGNRHLTRPYPVAEWETRLDASWFAWRQGAGRKAVNIFLQFFSAKVSENEGKKSENARAKIWAGVRREKTGCIKDTRAKTAPERKQSKL